MIIRADMDMAIRYADDFDTFLEELRGMGYSVRIGYSEKRQSEYLSLLAPGAEKARRDYRPVSYTHLDVYKRQVPALVSDGREGQTEIHGNRDGPEQREKLRPGGRERRRK